MEWEIVSKTKTTSSVELVYSSFNYSWIQIFVVTTALFGAKMNYLSLKYNIIT